MIDWAYYFAITLAIEVPIVVAIGPRGRLRSVTLDAVLANLLTHPLAWIAICQGANWWLIEAIVPLVEAGVYRSVTRMSPTRALAAALLANGVTAALSFVL